MKQWDHDQALDKTNLLFIVVVHVPEISHGGMTIADMQNTPVRLKRPLLDRIHCLLQDRSFADRAAQGQGASGANSSDKVVLRTGGFG